MRWLVGWVVVSLLVVGCQSEPVVFEEELTQVVETFVVELETTNVEIPTLESEAFQKMQNELRMTATTVSASATEEAASNMTPTPNNEPTIQPTNEPTTQADADVTFVRAVKSGETWTFHVTVEHPDTGWEDYADGWDVVLPDGTVLKRAEDDPFTRLLLHPHENEQPFTRSQSGLAIPPDVEYVTVRAHDLVDGFGGQEVVVNLTTDSGDFYQIDE